jgi:hypothetical protein
MADSVTLNLDTLFSNITAMSFKIWDEATISWTWALISSADAETSLVAALFSSEIW